ncbi:hypothetical protein DMA11_06305 [Marinilabiliaceae bacterium JC017]|nr:hypothetical protein DMA11_06305 [Marinilabiliaceae bacterium JC017]
MYRQLFFENDSLSTFVAINDNKRSKQYQQALMNHESKKYAEEYVIIADKVVFSFFLCQTLYNLASE